MSKNGDGYHKNISNEDLIALVQQQAAELGRTPKLKEFHSAASAVAIRRFGRWNNFLASAGLETKSKGKASLSVEEAIQLVQAKAVELGRTPKRTEFTQGKKLIRKLGGWHSFLQAAGLEPVKTKKDKHISDEQLIKLVQARAAELGRTPKRYEFKQGPTATIRYGSWQAFLQAAKLVSAKSKKGGKHKYHRNRLSEKQLIELVQARAAELGRTPKKSEFAQGQTATARYGSWHDFLASARLEMGEVKRKPWRMSNQQLIKLVRTQADELGRPPKKKEFPYAYQAVYRYGSWHLFLQAADLKSKPIIKVDEEELFEGIRSLASKLGYTPYKEDFQYGSYAAAKYGGWKNFIQAAGLPPCSTKRRVKDEQLVALIRAKTVELGRIPEKEEYSYCKTAIHRFGGWQKFLKAAEQMPAAVEKDAPKFSNNQLLRIIKDQAAEMGRAPNILEFEYAELAKARFRSWERFLKSANLEPEVSEVPKVCVKRKPRKSNEQLIEAVQAMAEELGRSPKIKEFSHSTTAVRRFGSWRAFLKSAGLELAPSLSLGYRYSKEQLIEMVQAQAGELGRTPKKREFPKEQSAVRRFGSWNAFIESAGLEPTRKPGKICQLSKEQLLDLLQAQANELGRTPKTIEFPYPSTAIYKFGSWKAFIRSAGLTLAKPVNEYADISNEELLEFVKERARYLGRAPKTKEFDYSQIAIRRFGKWHDFLLKAGLEPLDRGEPPRPHLSDEELIEALKKRADELRRVPKVTEFDRASLASYRFGTWNVFLKKAGMF